MNEALRCLIGKMNSLTFILSGGSGATVVEDTTPQTIETIGFKVLADAVFSSVTPAPGYTATNLTDVTYPAGITLPFRFSAWTLTSGSVIAVHG